MLEGGQMVASTSADGEAGNITITASDEVLISGTDPREEETPTQSGIFAVTEGSGAAGKINIQDAGSGHRRIHIYLFSFRLTGMNVEVSDGMPPFF